MIFSHLQLPVVINTHNFFLPRVAAYQDPPPAPRPSPSPFYRLPTDQMMSGCRDTVLCAANAGAAKRAAPYWRQVFAPVPTLARCFKEYEGGLISSCQINYGGGCGGEQKLIRWHLKPSVRERAALRKSSQVGTRIQNRSFRKWYWSSEARAAPDGHRTSSAACKREREKRKRTAHGGSSRGAPTPAERGA